MSGDSPWKTRRSEQVHDAKLFVLNRDKAEIRGAGECDYTWLRFKVVGVTVLAVDDDGTTYLIGQHRYPSSHFTWELIRGAGDLSGSAEAAARRELREEAGL